MSNYVKKDLISVIVPVYNLENYLRESLDSVINQSYENLEILLIDDGSTDNSLSILKEYERKDSRVKVFTKKNGGICDCMRMGVMLSSGEYISRHDGDDINDFYRYEHQLTFLKEGNYDLVGCFLKGFGNGSKSYQRAMEGLNSEIRSYEEQFFRIYTGRCINGGAIFGTREAFSKLMPFRKDFSNVEDRLIYLTFHRAGRKIGMLPEVRYYYRVHQTNTSLRPENAMDMAYKQLELIFTHLFVDFFEKAKNILIIEHSVMISIMNDVLRKFFTHKRYRFIYDYDLNSFMNDDIHFYDSSDTVIFSGRTYIKAIAPKLEVFGYKHLQNLFIIPL